MRGVRESALLVIRGHDRDHGSVDPTECVRQRGAERRGARPCLVHVFACVKNRGSVPCIGRRQLRGQSTDPASWWTGAAASGGAELQARRGARSSRSDASRSSDEGGCVPREHRRPVDSGRKSLGDPRREAHAARSLARSSARERAPEPQGSLDPPWPRGASATPSQPEIDPGLSTGRVVPLPSPSHAALPRFLRRRARRAEPRRARPDRVRLVRGHAGRFAHRHAPPSARAEERDRGDRVRRGVDRDDAGDGREARARAPGRGRGEALPPDPEAPRRARGGDRRARPSRRGTQPARHLLAFPRRDGRADRRGAVHPRGARGGAERGVRFCRARDDEATARLYEETIQPDEDAITTSSGARSSFSSRPPTMRRRPRARRARRSWRSPTSFRSLRV